MFNANMRFLRPFRTETQAYALYGGLFGLTFPIAGTLLQMIISGTALSVNSFIKVQLSEPILWIVDTAPIILGLFAALAGRRQDRLLELNERLNARDQELESTQLSLEQHVRERTREFQIASEQAEKRASQLQAIAEISHSIALTQNLDELFPLITRSISQRLGFYHTGIFLLDESHEYAVLVAANSDGGQRMLKRGHKLKAGGTGIVGYVAQAGRARVALETENDLLFFNNPDLPRTRAEIALPLNAGGQLIGVLDVQSEQPSAFRKEDIDTLNTLASQVAIVIQNARLFEEARSALETYVRAGQRGWLEHVENKVPGYSYLPDGTLAVPPEQKQEQIRNLLAASQTLVLDSATDGTAPTLAIPVKVRDQVLGMIHIEAREGNRKWSDDEIAMVKSISERTALALENARLFEETSRRAERERIISEVTTRISESNNFDHILQTTIQELGRSLGATRTFIQLQTSAIDGSYPSAEKPGQV